MGVSPDDRSTESKVEGGRSTFPGMQSRNGEDRGPSAAGRCSVFPWESRRTRRSGRDRRRPDLAALESLEGRELLAFSPLGFSLPELSIRGFAAPAASWGGQVT